MKLGIVTPVVTLNPKAHSPWERDAKVDDLVRFVQEADRLGYAFCTASEHVAVPAGVAEERGSRYYDPVATLAFLAAHTEHIALATYSLVLGYHHPLAIAKQAGTLDRLSGGRLILGVGVGSLREEFELLGASFDNRGERADDALRALRAALGQQEPTYDGPSFSFSDVVVDPVAVQDRIPIWVGGRTRRSLRRAVELGDAWSPFRVEPEQIGSWLGSARETDAWDARERPLDVVLQARHLDPVDDPDDTRAAVEAHVAAGVTTLATRFRSRSVAHAVEQLAALRELVSP